MALDPVPQPDREARVPRPLLWVLVFFALVGLLGMAFVGGLIAARWLGRERAPDLTASAGGVVLPPARGEAPSAASPSGPAVLLGAIPAGSPSGSPSAATAGSTGAEVVAYFAGLDRVLAQGKQSGDPNALARKILEQMVSGDTRGFEELLSKQREIADGLRQIQPPSACAEHHRRTLALVERGISLLTTARDAIAAENPLALASLLSSGQEVEAEARAVDVLGAEIRRRYGL